MKKHIAIAGRFLFLTFALVDASLGVAGTIKVDCDAGNALGTALRNLKPGDIVLLHGTCRENIVIQPEVQCITVDGQRQTTINPPDSNQPAIQVLSREVTIKGLTVAGGTFGIAINRGATAVIDGNTVRNATISGIEVHRTVLGALSTTRSKTARTASSCLAVRPRTSASSAQATRLHSPTSFETTGTMGSWCYAAPMPASSAMS